jgi:hypothetical protein
MDQMLKFFSVLGGGEGVKNRQQNRDRDIFRSGQWRVCTCKIIADVRIAGRFDAGQRDRFHLSHSSIAIQSSIKDPSAAFAHFFNFFHMGSFPNLGQC